MSSKANKKRAVIGFAVTFAIVVIALISTVFQNDMYNALRHTVSVSERDLFTHDRPKDEELSVVADARDSTWTKVFDFNNEGLEEHNYQGYTVDFYITNNTNDKIQDYTFRLNFEEESFLLSAWNGSIEIHQKTDKGEIVDLIPDLREFNYKEHVVETFLNEGESLVWMKPGDYLYYTPSSSANAMEIPINPMEGSVPGIIMYYKIGDDIEDNMSVDVDYSFDRKLVGAPLFWVAMGVFFIWLIALVIYGVITGQVNKYKERHTRDNEIINESMETFTGFIDAKDPYTNGHSLRVAKYTKILAEKLGFRGDELERIYYVALLHDCGKIAVPDKILGKPGKLTEEEFEVIKSHTVRGGEIMSHFKSIENAGEGALYHHERYDGNGYPEGRAGEDIPFIARIICVADSYDAMNTNRVYREKLSKEAIIEEFERCKGKQFDPQIADVMISLIKKDELNIDI